MRRAAGAALGGSIGAAAIADAGQAGGAALPPGSPQHLETQTRLALRWAGREPADWVRPKAGVEHNVVIVGAGQSGLSLAYGLKRRGIGRVSLIDQAAPGQAGIWRRIARMQQLRTPKTLAGLEPDNPALGFRAWFESLNGPAAFDALDRIPRLAWADYLDWYRQTTGTTVRYGTRLVSIEPAADDTLRLHLEVDGQPRVETTRKLILATGYAGAGGPAIPDFLQALPSSVWTHSTGSIPVNLAGKVVGVIGAGSNAFDAAAVALEGGAAEVHMFNRRAYVDYQGGPATGPAPDRGYAGPTDLNYELPEVVRWRNYLLGERRVASVPLDSLQRAVAFRNFRLHLNASLSDVAMNNGQIVARVGSRTHRFDYLIAGTGYRIDLSAQPELARIHDAIALWRHRYQPQPGEEHAGGGAHPYLGPAFEFQPRAGVKADYLRHIHCFNLAGQLSFGIPVGDVPSVVDHPRVIAGIARDLFVAGVDVATHQRFVNLPQVAPDPAPYQSAVDAPQRGRGAA